MTDAADVVKVEAAWGDSSWRFNPTWTDITADVLRVTIANGRSNGPGTAFQAGRCTIELINLDGAYDPAHPDSPLFGELVRNRQVRVTTVTGGEILFYGWIDELRVASRDTFSVATIAATDGLRLLAQTDLRDVPVLRELTGHRARRLMVAAGVKSEWVGTMHRGEVMMGPEVLNTDALSALVNAELTEGGFFYFEDGVFNFRRRHSAVLRPQWSTTQQTFAEVGTTGIRFENDPIPVSTGEYRWFANRVVATGYTGTPIEATTVGFLDIPTTRSIQSGAYWDADVAGLASYWSDVWGQVVTWPAAIRVPVWPITDTSALSAVTGGSVKLLNRVAVKWTPPGHSTQLNSSCAVETIAHEITMDPPWWQMTLSLSAWSLLGTPSDLAGDKTAVQPGWIRLGVDDVSIGNNRTWAY